MAPAIEPRPLPRPPHKKGGPNIYLKKNVMLNIWYFYFILFFVIKFLYLPYKEASKYLVSNGKTRQKMVTCKKNNAKLRGYSEIYICSLLRNNFFSLNMYNNYSWF